VSLIPALVAEGCGNLAIAREFKHGAVHLNSIAAAPMAQLADRLAGATDGRGQRAGGVRAWPPYEARNFGGRCRRRDRDF
jgi:hypothetical protein